LALVFAGFSPVLTLGAALSIVFGAGLTRSWRWLGYFAFLFALISAIILYASLGPLSLLGWVWIALIVTNIVAAICLFLAIWRAKEPVTV
jgi:hypothetical protein